MSDSTLFSDMPLPAPLWRRLAAAVYDGLVLLAIWMAATLLAVIATDAAGLPHGPRFMQIYLFLLSFLFFGWFWTHGGQTVGMRAWRLRVRSVEGGDMGWPTAMLRFCTALLSWGLAGLGVVWCLIDRQHRSWHDLATQTEVVVMPKVQASGNSTGGRPPEQPG